MNLETRQLIVGILLLAIGAFGIAGGAYNMQQHNWSLWTIIPIIACIVIMYIGSGLVFKSVEGKIQLKDEE